MATILAVDDSGYARRVHRRMLETGGHTVLEASTGMGALEAYVLHRPDVVLLDLSMEDIGGLEVLRKLREADPEARVIVVSADIQQSTERLVTEAGGMRFLGKPVGADRLLGAITAVLEAANR